MSDFSGASAIVEASWPTSSRVRVFDLAVPLEPGLPRHPNHPPFAFVLVKMHGESNYPGGISTSMEMFATGGHVGTHIDALGHVALDGHVHGSRPIAGEQSFTGGLTAGSIEEAPPIIGRGHLLDAPALLGRDLSPADGVGAAQFEDWFADGEQPGPGSVVLVRTGWMSQHWPDTEAYIGLGTGLPGVTLDGARWLTERGVIATGTDTMNYEHKPDTKKVAMSVHVHHLVENGVFIMEMMSLDALAASGVRHFTFIALPLRIRGGSGSPIRPVAVVDL